MAAETYELEMERVGRETRRLIAQQETEADRAMVLDAGNGAVADIGLRAAAADMGVEPNPESVLAAVGAALDELRAALALARQNRDEARIMLYSGLVLQTEQDLEIFRSVFSDAC